MGKTDYTALFIVADRGGREDRDSQLKYGLRGSSTITPRGGKTQRAE